MSIDTYLIINIYSFPPSLGHEITHAFDDVGILYDASGDFRPLYDGETLNRFRRASDCVRRQYSGYSVRTSESDREPGLGMGTSRASASSTLLRVDGNLTLGENIADQGGLKISEVRVDTSLGKMKTNRHAFFV